MAERPGYRGSVRSRVWRYDGRSEQSVRLYVWLTKPRFERHLFSLPLRSTLDPSYDEVRKFANSKPEMDVPGHVGLTQQVTRRSGHQPVINALHSIFNSVIS